MATHHFNGLSESEQERLVILIEECSEVIQEASKILRHGYDSKNPLHAESPHNRESLEKEIGHVRFAVARMIMRGDLDESAIYSAENHKAESIWRWLHHG